MEYARTVAERLPRTFAAMGAGTINPVHLRIIEEETSILSTEHAAQADAELAGTLTYGKLRAAGYRLVLKLDPDVDRRRKEAARRVAEVRRFRENSGNAGLIVREMPSAEVIASWQHLGQRAADLRDAGFPGTMDELRVRAMLDLLQERDSRAELAGQGDADPGAEDASPGTEDTGPGGEDTGPSLAAQVTITVPWSAQEDGSSDPAEVDGFGVVDNTDAKGSCDHGHAETGYRPSRRLQHLIRARNARCTAPGCRRPAARCDLDHTVPWDKGGVTCECDLAPRCKR